LLQKILERKEYLKKTGKKKSKDPVFKDLCLLRYLISAKQYKLDIPIFGFVAVSTVAIHRKELKKQYNLPDDICGEKFESNLKYLSMIR
jgi:hypothetical protein